KDRVEEYVGDGAGYRYHRPESVKVEQWERLWESRFPPNASVALDHDETVSRFIELGQSLDESAVLEGFVLGCSGTWPRGRQSLISFAFAKHLKPHRFVASKPAGTNQLDDSSDRCAVCGIPARWTGNPTHEVFRAHWGYAWNEHPEDWVFELEERLSLSTPRVDEGDRERFTAFVRCIQSAEPGETPGQLDKRLTKAKVLPKTDKYRRYGILLALAEVGVLPAEPATPWFREFRTCAETAAAARGAGGNPRSDIVIPLSLWRGDTPIDDEVLQKLFGAWLT
ncbi:MAG: hypothetical protein AAFY60_20625, partial [Myxococcota bacterium]